MKIIIGAGPAGITAAYQLSKEMPDVLLFEAADCVGGLARSIQLWGQTVDLGPHRFFSKDRRVNELWLEVVGRDYVMLQRQTRILYQGKLFQYPLEAFDALGKLGPVEALRCLGSYARQLVSGSSSGGNHVAQTSQSARPVEYATQYSQAKASCSYSTGQVPQVSEPASRIRGAAQIGKSAVQQVRKPAPQWSENTGAGDRQGACSSFEDWVCRRFGRRLFEIFFKTYSEKLWGIPCTELDADFAAQRIKKFSLSAAIKSALFPNHRKRHHTLVDEFAYPLGGTGMVYERMADAVRRNGGELRLNTPVKKVLTEEVTLTPALSHPMGEGEARASRHTKVTGVELASGERIPCDKVISTMPLTTLVRQLDDVPPDVMEACRQLQFRNTILVYLEVTGENPFPDHWIYVHSAELRCGRATNFANWKPESGGRKSEVRNQRADSQSTSNIQHPTPNTESAAILAMEYWCNAEDDFWKWSDARLSELAREEIVRSGLVLNPEKLGRSFVFRIPKCYPVYRRGYQQHLLAIREYLNGISGLQVIGRYGAFKYNNQDHSILMGRLAAENVLREKHNDLWGINTDYENYQEACSITDTGLVKAG